MSNTSNESLEEENRRLKIEVKQLRDEISERDALITIMEAQIKVLVKENSEKFLGQGSSDQKPTPPRAGLHTRDPAGSSFSSSSRSRLLSDDDDESTRPPIPTGYHQLTPDPEVATSNSTPSRKERDIPESTSPLHRLSLDLSESGMGTLLSETIAEEDEDAESSDNHDNKDYGRGIEVIRTRSLIKAQGAIKALPRELSIRNADDDDITKYSLDDQKMPTYHLEAAEMRDAYNARGLYTGFVSRKHQVPHGEGIMNYHLKGRRYEGEWVLGHWHGYGKIRSANGDIYEGPVQNDLRIGQGKLYYADGRVFDGKFQDDDPVEGTLMFPDGAQYVGELHNQARHGYGTYYFTDGSTYEGMSAMNSFEGHGKMTWVDGGWYEGEWQAGEITGFGKEVRADGSIRHEGRWSKGVPIR